MSSGFILTFAQGRGGPPKMRKHQANQIQKVRPVKANLAPTAKNNVQIKRSSQSFTIKSNGIPAHKVGAFPNRGNPHSIRVQSYSFKFPPKPVMNKVAKPTVNSSGFGPPSKPFGIAVNGIIFDPGTAEFWNGDRKLGWNYEALGGAVPLGVDENYAHVQPTGAYHYHGLPKLLMKSTGMKSSKHSPLIGWAADGFPIYALYAYKDPKKQSSIIKVKSSYRLKKGKRPSSPNGPGGKYDGAFSVDYEYVKGLGDLDECNGRFTVTPEFPKGTYAYFLTEEFPVIPRAFRGNPVELRSLPGMRRR